MKLNNITKNANLANTSPTTVNTNNRENLEGSTQNHNPIQSVQSAASNIANGYPGSLQPTVPPGQFHQEARQASAGAHANLIATITQTNEKNSINNDGNTDSGTSSDDDKKMPPETKKNEASDQKSSPFHAEAITASRQSHGEIILSLTETDSKKISTEKENSRKDENVTLTNTERLEKKDASRTESIPHAASLQRAPEKKNSSSSPKKPIEKPIASLSAIHESTIDSTGSPPDLRRHQAPLSQPGAFSVNGVGISRSNSSISSFSDTTDDSSINPTSSETDNDSFINSTDRNNIPMAIMVDESTTREGEDLLTPYDPEIPVNNAYIATHQAPQAPSIASESEDQSDDQSVDQSIDRNLNHRSPFQKLCLDPVKSCISFFTKS
ncbi:MAG: hypothetical protein ACJAUP_002521 [Cellvibrionaceae bacterium]|jgi:hypothetical protein